MELTLAHFTFLMHLFDAEKFEPDVGSKYSGQVAYRIGNTNFYFDSSLGACSIEKKHFWQKRTFRDTKNVLIKVLKAKGVYSKHEYNRVVNQVIPDKQLEHFLDLCDKYPFHSLVQDEKTYSTVISNYAAAYIELSSSYDTAGKLADSKLIEFLKTVNEFDKLLYQFDSHKFKKPSSFSNDVSMIIDTPIGFYYWDFEPFNWEMHLYSKDLSKGHACISYGYSTSGNTTLFSCIHLKENEDEKMNWDIDISHYIFKDGTESLVFSHGLDEQLGVCLNNMTYCHIYNFSDKREMHCVNEEFIDFLIEKLHFYMQYINEFIVQYIFE